MTIERKILSMVRCMLDHSVALRVPGCNTLGLYTTVVAEDILKFLQDKLGATVVHTVAGHRIAAKPSLISLGSNVGTGLIYYKV